MRFLPRRLAHGEEATLVEHLDELRSRLFFALGAVACGFAIAFVFHERLVHALTRPLPDDLDKPITLGVAEPFLTSITLSLYAGFLVALPIVLWQVWSFFAPAVEEARQRLVLAFVVLSAVLMLCGVAFGYFVALPQAVHFLTGYDDQLYNVQVRARDYYSFASTVLLAVGVVFQLPLFVLALTRLGILSTAQLRRNRRVGYFVVAVVAVLLPGIDPVTTFFEALPLVVLYEGSIWLSVLLDRRAARATPAAEPS